MTLDNIHGENGIISSFEYLANKHLGLTSILMWGSETHLEPWRQRVVKEMGNLGKKCKILQYKKNKERKKKRENNDQESLEITIQQNPPYV